MKPTNLFVAMCCVSLGVGPAVADRIIRVEPGLWEYSHTLEIPGLLAPIIIPRTICISPVEAQQNLSDLLGELSDDGNCIVSGLKDDLSTVSFDLVCHRNSGGVSMAADGGMAFRYGRAKITGEATGSISIGELETAVNARGDARRIGRCNN